MNEIQIQWTKDNNVYMPGDLVLFRYHLKGAIDMARDSTLIDLAAEIQMKSMPTIGMVLKIKHDCYEVMFGDKVINVTWRYLTPVT